MNAICKDTAKIIDELFIALQVIFPAFKQAWPTQFEIDEAKYHWIQAFKESDLSDTNKIELGIRRCRGLSKSFVPSPGEFIHLCSPTAQDLGLPLVEHAYHEACLNSHPTAVKKWSHPIIYHAATMTTFYVLQRCPEKESFKLFEAHYKILIKKLLAGEKLSEIEIPKMLEEKWSGMTEKGVNGLKNLKNTLGIR